MIFASGSYVSNYKLNKMCLWNTNAPQTPIFWETRPWYLTLTSADDLDLGTRCVSMRCAFIPNMSLVTKLADRWTTVKQYAPDLLIGGGGGGGGRGAIKIKLFGKSTNCLSWAISPFPTVFSKPFWEFLPFSRNLKLLSANSFRLEESKICCFEKG